MKIELTEQQEQAANRGLPVEVVNPATNRAYLVFAKETFEGPRAALVSNHPAPAAVEPFPPPGVQQSRAAFLRDLPDLLRNKKHDRWFALYHGARRIRIACKYEDLLQECRTRGIGRDAYYIGIIRHHEPEPEEIEHLPFEYDEASPRQP